MNAILILNATAGTAANSATTPTAEELRAAFAQIGISLAVWDANRAGIENATQAAIERRPDAIFAGGGDGTVSTIAGHLAGGDIPFGVVPLGTLNHFARDLGLTPNWRDASRAMARATVRWIDVAEVNGRVFINNCSLGSYGEAVRRRDALRRECGHGKWPAMLLASWAVFRELRRLRLHIETPSESRDVRSPFVVVANNRYTGHVLDASLRPRLDEGRLWLYTTRARTRWSLIRLIAQALTRSIDDTDALDVRDTVEVTISASRGPVHVACDGEPVNLTLPLRFKIRPRALLVLAPTDAPSK